MISGSADFLIKVWNTTNFQLISTLVGHTGYVYSLSFSTDGKKIVSGSSDYSIKIWNASSYELIETFNPKYGIYL